MPFPKNDLLLGDLLHQRFIAPDDSVSNRFNGETIYCLERFSAANDLVPRAIYWHEQFSAADDLVPRAIYWHERFSAAGDSS